MDGNWIIVGALCGPDDGITRRWRCCRSPTSRIEDVWHTDGMRATGSNDVVIDDAFVPAHRLVAVSDIYRGAAPGATVHEGHTYRWPMVPALALLAAMPALGSAERAVEIYTDRLAQRYLAYEGVLQKDKPMASIHLGEALVRLRALRALLSDTVDTLEETVAAGDPVSRAVRGQARLAAAHIVHESRARDQRSAGIVGRERALPGPSLQRVKRDVDVIAGHVVFDHDTSRELAGALTLGIPIPRTAMV